MWNPFSQPSSQPSSDSPIQPISPASSEPEQIGIIQPTMASYHVPDDLDYSQFKLMELTTLLDRNDDEIAKWELKKLTVKNDDPERDGVIAQADSRLAGYNQRALSIKSAMEAAKSNDSSKQASGGFQPGCNHDRQIFQNQITNALKDLKKFRSGDDPFNFIKIVESKRMLILRSPALDARKEWLPDLFDNAVLSTLIDPDIINHMGNYGKIPESFDDLKTQLVTNFGSQESLFHRLNNFYGSRPEDGETFVGFCNRLHSSVENHRRHIRAAFLKEKKKDMDEHDNWEMQAAYIAGHLIQSEGEETLGINWQVIAPKLDSCFTPLEVGRVVKEHVEKCNLDSNGAKSANQTKFRRKGPWQKQDDRPKQQGDNPKRKNRPGRRERLQNKAEQIRVKSGDSGREVTVKSPKKGNKSQSGQNEKSDSNQKKGHTTQSGHVRAVPMDDESPLNC